MQPLTHNISHQNSLLCFQFFIGFCQVSIHFLLPDTFSLSSLNAFAVMAIIGIVSASGCFSDRIVFVAVSPSITGSMELLNAHLLVSLQICTKIHFLYYHEIFLLLQCTYLFQTLLFLFPFSENCNQRGAPENFFSNAPLRFLFFCFSVRSIRNAPSPLPRRPARRYRLRTLCTDPESHHVFQAQWCVRRTGTW